MSTQNVKLPDIGEGVTEGELVKWLVKVGDTVSADQPVAEVMTDKATVEVPSPYPGVVKELKFKEGDVIPIETVIALVEGDGAGSKPAAKAATANGSAGHAAKPAPAQGGGGRPAPAMMASAPTARSSAPASSGGMDVYPPAADSHVLATPATRRLAREMGVDINGLSGTGLADRVTREDVLKSKDGHAGGPSIGGTGDAPARSTTMEIPKPA
ncbi:MAG: biotin/lipoyl-containing protein, partial [Bdellovibrionales bacterium]